MTEDLIVPISLLPAAIIPDGLATDYVKKLQDNPEGWAFLLTELLSRPTPANMIVRHDGPRGTRIPYVEGAYAKATRAALTRIGVTSDFEVIETAIDSSEVPEVSCLGRITFKYHHNGVLDTITSMQWGGCAKRPGMTWGSARKGAATDSEKKCLNEFGWAMDVYSSEAEWSPPSDKEDLKKQSVETLYNMGQRAGMTTVQVDEFVVKEANGQKVEDLEVRDLTAIKRKLIRLALEEVKAE